MTKIKKKSIDLLNSNICVHFIIFFKYDIITKSKSCLTFSSITFRKLYSTFLNVSKTHHNKIYFHKYVSVLVKTDNLNALKSDYYLN